MRLDQFIAHSLAYSRKKAHQLIKDEKVLVNNVIITKSAHLINEKSDKVFVSGKQIIYQKYIYLLFNKPSNLVSAVTDNFYPTVVEYINYPRPIFPVGRLDKDTEGLLLLTNDGLLAHRLTSQQYKIKKTYYVETKQVLTKEYHEAFEKGFDLLDFQNKKYHTLPADIKIIDKNKALVTIIEGKFHQIKKMFHAMNNEVTFLKRVAFASLNLSDELSLGEYRHLSDEEVKELYKLVKMEKS